MASKRKRKRKANGQPKGNPIVKFRCPPDLLAWLHSRVEWSQMDRKAGVLDLSSLVRELVEQGRAKWKRSRTWRKRKRELAEQREGQA